MEKVIFWKSPYLFVAIWNFRETKSVYSVYTVCTDSDVRSLEKTRTLRLQTTIHWMLSVLQFQNDTHWNIGYDVLGWASYTCGWWVGVGQPITSSKLRLSWYVTIKWVAIAFPEQCPRVRTLPKQNMHQLVYFPPWSVDTEYNQPQIAGVRYWTTILYFHTLELYKTQSFPKKAIKYKDKLIKLY